MIKSFDKNLIEEYIQEGWLRGQWSKDEQLFVLDYTKQTTYNNHWDEITMACRGIVLDKNYNVVMPCMPKFFNYEQLSSDMQKHIQVMFNGNPLITKKYDGCLAAIFPYKGELIITSKCSFDSFVVNAAKEIIKNQLFVNQLEDMSLGLICEVIHPDTHILVNYGDTKELRVITGFNINTLEEFSYKEMEDRVNIIGSNKIKMVEEQYDMDLWILNKWQRTHDASEEGFVVKFKDNIRVKFKSQQYLNCAKAAHHINYRAFVQYMVDICGEYNNIDEIFKNLQQHISHLPDELQPEAIKIMKQINVNYAHIMQLILDVYYDTLSLSDKDLGLCYNNNVMLVKGFIFDLRHSKDITKKVLQELLKNIVEV